MKVNSTLISPLETNISTSLPNFGPLLLTNFNDSLSFFFNQQPPPPPAPGPSQTPLFALLDQMPALQRNADELLKKLKGLIYSLLPKAPLKDLLHDKMAFIGPQRVSYQNYSVYPLFANSTTLTNSKILNLSYQLSDPGANGFRKLTINCNTQEFTYECLLVDDPSKPASSIVDQSTLAESDQSQLMPFELDSKLTVYINKSGYTSSQIQQIERLMTVGELKQELIFWFTNPGRLVELDPEHVKASRRIIDCFLNQCEELDLSRCKLEALPPTIKKLTHLKKLHLNSNYLKEFPSYIKDLTLLTDLDLSDNDLTILAEFIEHLPPQLCKLNLNRSNLRSVSKGLTRLTQLRELNLSFNLLTALPDDFSNLTRLEKVDLTHNRLTSIPDCFTHLTGLKDLNLKGNSLTKLPFGFSRLTQLESLDLAFNPLENLSDELSQLTNLEKLDLSSTQLAIVPPFIGALEKLRILSLGSNKLTVLPKFISNLTQLQSLYLDNNQLTALPGFVCELSNLNNLVISYNQIEHLPKNIGQLNRLCSYFSPGCNPLRGLPLSFLDLPPSLTIDLLEDSLSKRVLENLQALIAERKSSGQKTLSIRFNIPHHISSLDLESAPIISLNLDSIEESINQLKTFAGLNDFDFKLSYSDTPVRSVQLWLNNLLRSPDFTEASPSIRKQLARMVLNHFSYAEKHPEFRSSFFYFYLNRKNVSSEVNSYTLSVIELDMIISLRKQQEQAKTFDQTIQLLKNAWAVYRLQQIADNKFKELKLCNELDVHLAFLIHCKELLAKQGVQLPFPSKLMQFSTLPQVQKKDFVEATKKVVKKMKSENMSKQLFNFIFHDFNSGNDLGEAIANFCLDLFEATFKAEVDPIKSKFNEKRREIDDANMTDSKKMAAYHKLKEDKIKAYTKILERFNAPG